MSHIDLAVLGGSGLYRCKGLGEVEEISVETPFGVPSDSIHVGTLSGRRVAFLARHGRNHRFLPSEIPYRANIWALKSLGVQKILSVSAVGSMRETIEPRQMVLVDQFIDRTHGRPSTFFGDGIVAHVSLADPTCPSLRAAVVAGANGGSVTVHRGGTYVCIEGPAFSTRSESELYRGWDVDVIGMTNMQEARLSREAEICFATLAMVTDYDCWHQDEDDVTVGGILETLAANSLAVESLLRDCVVGLTGDSDCHCGRALENAILTPREAIPADARTRLDPILRRVLTDSGQDKKADRS